MAKCQTSPRARAVSGSIKILPGVNGCQKDALHPLCLGSGGGGGRWLDTCQAAARPINYDMGSGTRQALVNPTPLVAEWSLLGAQIKEKLLIPAGNFLLDRWHCSAGEGETKAECIHTQGASKSKHQGNGPKLQTPLGPTDLRSLMFPIFKNHKKRVNYSKRANPI